ncbi:MAG: glycosyltransferase family 4 protein [Peptococcaceae bacterium]|nr:glycosyltransferase family 4 protein [Peptococcaceae bacterium]
MKVLLGNKFFYIKGGSETYLFKLKALLEEHQIETIDFAMADEKNKASKYADYFVTNVDYNSKMKLREKIKSAVNIIYSREAHGRISELISDTRPDIAHLHVFQHQLSPSILYALKDKGIPIVYTAHDLKCLCPNYRMLVDGRICEDCRGRRYHNCFKHACVKNSRLKSLVNVIEMTLHGLLKSYDLVDIIITPSKFYKNKFIEYGFEKEKVVYLPNFLDADANTPIGDFDHYCIYLGRLSHEKGVVTLLKAMEQVDGIQLYVIGTGPMEGQIKELINENKMSGKVKLLGFKSGAELEDLIKKAMFSIMPSEWYENAPYSLLEMMAWGKAVIGANIGGIPEMIDEGKSGLLFKPGDHLELAEKINLLKDNPDLVLEYGRNARAKLIKEYNSRDHFDNLMHIYRGLID